MHQMQQAHHKLSIKQAHRLCPRSLQL